MTHQVENDPHDPIWYEDAVWCHCGWWTVGTQSWEQYQMHLMRAGLPSEAKKGAMPKPKTKRKPVPFNRTGQRRPRHG